MAQALGTTLASNGMEAARRCCGGHGYSLASGLPTLFASYVQNATWEGDNNVLYLQVHPSPPGVAMLSLSRLAEISSDMMPSQRTAAAQLHAAGLHAPALTVVCILQQGRSLVKALAGVSEGKPPSGSAAYLANVEQERGAKCSTTCEDCWREPGHVTAALRWVLCTPSALAASHPADS